MTEHPTPDPHLPLQPLPATLPTPDAAAALAGQLMRQRTSLTDAVASVGALLADHNDVDAVAVTTTTTRPESPQGWTRLGERAWLWQRIREGAPCQFGPRDVEAASDHTLSTPWLSRLGRKVGLVAVADTRQLPDVAAQDREELAGCGIGAWAAIPMLCDGAMYGSLALARTAPGPWAEDVLGSLEVLSAALAARMAILRAEEALADAISRGDRARSQQKEFFSTLRHEMRTPVAAVVGTADVLAAESESVLESERGTAAGEALAEFAAVVREDAGVIATAGEQLLAVVDDLLEVGAELGSQRTLEPVDAAAAARDVLHWVRSAALANDVAITCEVDPAIRVLGTPSGLRQILTNLVGNAIVHNPGGTVHVSAAPSSDDQGRRRVRLRVTDTGPGLTLEQQAHVFRPFVRFADADVPGTGLGLAVSRSLADRDGAMIGVESAPGSGATFWLDMPMAT